MAGQRQKPRSQLQNQRGGRGNLITVQGGQEPPPVPAAPDGLMPGARQIWINFWESALARLVDRKAHMPACHRWIEAESELMRLRPLANKSPLVTGSTGQLRKNPLFDVIAEHTRAVERFEEHFGGTLLAQMRLGIAIGEAAETLGDLQASLAGGFEDTETEDEFSEFFDAEFTVGGE